MTMSPRPLSQGRTVGSSTLVTHQVSATTFSGPIPPPELLAHYNEIIPDGANRILTMVENQSAHRIDLESTVLKSEAKRANWGVASAFTLSLFLFALSGYLILQGHDAAGTTVATADLVGLCGIFIYGTNSRRAERVQKDAQNRQLTKR